MTFRRMCAKVFEIHGILFLILRHCDHRSCLLITKSVLGNGKVRNFVTGSQELLFSITFKCVKKAP